jgi:hypothetical protein
MNEERLEEREKIIDKIVDEFMNTDWWDMEWDLNRILHKHLSTLKEDKDNVVEIKEKDFSKEQIDENDIQWFRNICKANGMNFWTYDVEELIKMYRLHKADISFNDATKSIG